MPHLSFMTSIAEPLLGRMIIIAVVVLNAFYPGKYLNRAMDPHRLDEKHISDAELATPTMHATAF